MKNKMKGIGNNRTTEENEEETVSFLTKGRKALGFFCSVFVIAMFLIFPLYYEDYYFNIMAAKYRFYYISVLLLLAGTLIIGGYMLVQDMRLCKGENTAGFLKKFELYDTKMMLAEPNFWLLLFFVFSVISTLQSDYQYEAVWGNEGRYTGLFLLLMYIVSFLICGKFANLRKYFLNLFLLSGLLACLFGMSDFFKMNLLHFKDDMYQSQADIFVSTFGNINVYTSYVAMLLAVSGVLFATEKKPWKCLLYYVSMMVGFFAIIMGESDNAYLALGALFAFLPFYLFKTWSGIRRYLVMIASFFTAVAGVGVIVVKYEGKTLSIGGLFNVLVGLPGLKVIVLGLWLLAGALYLIKLTSKKEEKPAGKGLRIAWAALIGIVVVAVCFILYDANIAGNAERYQKIRNYVVFNDQWGSSRGGAWRLCMEDYLNFPLHHKLFGYGPDTFGIMTVNFNYDEMVSKFGVIFDSAHNEYLQYFITIGPLGLGAYLGVLISSCVRMAKKGGKNPYIMALLFAVICYGAQAAVNISLPIVAPIMWTLMMLGVAGCREDQIKAENSEKGDRNEGNGFNHGRRSWRTFLAKKQEKSA